MATVLSRILEAQIASGDPIDVRHSQVEDRLSGLFEVVLLVRSANADIDLDAVAGMPASFTIRAGQEFPKTRQWSGIASSLTQIAVEEGGLSTYRLTIVPTMWLLTQRRNNRIFQRMSEVDIAKKLLGEWDIKPEMRLTGEYKKRKYRVQYNESDHAFLSRMLEDAGITYFFEDADGETKLVLTDAPQSAEARPPIPFRDSPSDGDLEHITSVRVNRRVRPGKYLLHDQDYRRPNFKVQASAKGGTSPEENLERYHYVPGSFLFQSDKGGATPVADDKGKYRADESEGATLTKKRLDAKRASARTISFQTNVLDVGPGIVMSVLDHPKAELAPGKRLLVTTLSFQGGQAGEWTQTCEAVDAGVPYFPAIVTPKPKVMGVETATVVGPPGEQIHVDEFGRVRVQFQWDREGSSDDNSSPYIPVSHPWAGGGFGMMNIPRVGQEVIVDFMSGDPDRPIIVGRVYTNTQKVPYTLPAAKTKSGWKSQTVGGAGYNEMSFDDQPGSELVNMQAEKDLNKLVKNDESVNVGNDRTKQVGNNDTHCVGNDRSHTIGNDETITVGNNQTITIGVNQTLTVGANQTITLPAGNQTETITGNRTFTLTGNLTETITGNSALTQVGNQTETLTGNQTETVTGNTTRTQTGSHSTTQVGDRSLLQIGSQSEIQVGSKTEMQMGDRLDLQLGGRKDIQIGSRLDVQIGDQTRVEIGTLSDTVIGTRNESTVGPSTETVSAVKTLNAPTTVANSGETTVNAGTLTVNGAAITVNGASIDIIGAGIVNIQGSVIKLNC